MTAMRILVAVDGSSRAAIALDLVASIPWPEGSTIRVVTVIQQPLAMYTMPLAPAPALPAHVERIEADMRLHAEAILEEASRVAAHAGRAVERRLRVGRPGSSIVDEALEWKAHLVVLGSRGHGAIASMLLGSVSAEVVDHAPCPVIVARRPSLTRAILAHDGSAFALAAEEVVRTWPIFRRVAVEVVSVAHVAAPWRTGLAPTVYAEALEAYEESAATASAEHRRIADESARRLQAEGLPASAVVVDGDPAETIMRVADDHSADLVVLGTHGRTGVARALLGSVARNVMQHAACSVMVVRTPPAEQAAGERTIAGPTGAEGA